MLYKTTGKRDLRVMFIYMRKGLYRDFEKEIWTKATLKKKTSVGEG